MQIDFTPHLVMGQDWGGPISMAVAVDRADRVRGVVLGNTFRGALRETRFCRVR